MSSASEAVAAPRTRPVVGIIVGSASAIAGALLLLLWVQQRVAPAALRLPPMPFFDHLSRWDLGGGFMIAYGIAGLLLAMTGVAILRRMRFAPVLFAVLGWGGFLFTIAALIPGDDLKFRIHTVLTNAVRLGAVPKDATVWDVIPSRYYVYAGLAVGAWLLLLIAGTLHLFRNRSLYNS